MHSATEAGAAWNGLQRSPHRDAGNARDENNLMMHTPGGKNTHTQAIANLYNAVGAAECLQPPNAYSCHQGAGGNWQVWPTGHTQKTLQNGAGAHTGARQGQPAPPGAINIALEC